MQRRRHRWQWAQFVPLLLLLISSWSGKQLLTAAQDAAASPAPTPAATDGAATPPLPPSPAAAAGSSSPAAAAPPTPAPGEPTPPPAAAAAPPPPAAAPPPAAGAPPPPPAAADPAPPSGAEGEEGDEGDDGNPPPAVPPPAGGAAGTGGSSNSSSNAGGVSGGASDPAAGSAGAGSTPPAAGSTPPAAGSTPPAAGATDGSNPTPPPVTTTPTPGTGAGDSGTPAPVQQPPAVVAPEPTQNASLPAYVLPTPDETAIDGISPSDDECKLMSALYAAMGAGGNGGCGSSSSSGSSGTAQLQDTQTSMQQNSELAKSSARFRDGLFTDRNGARSCISTAGAAQMAQTNARGVQLQSLDDARELPDIEDPACEDQYATRREGCPPRVGGGGPVFLEDPEGEGSPSPNPGPDSSGEVSPAASPEPVDMRDCSKKFTRAGTRPRSVAVVLLKWRREYYKSKEQCCTEQGNKPGCDCEWGGHTYDSLPPPKAYSRLFTDECDKGPSLNRAYYDMTGGRITFHSKLRVPVPSGFSLAGSGRSVVTVSYNNGTEYVDESAPALGPEPEPSPSPEPYVVPEEAIETANSYLDPNGVDVYGWATLDAMRTEEGHCKDWCSDAMQQLGVRGSDYNHVVCLQLLGSPALCDTCKGGACLNTCPADSGITTGCGCATCYYAWGGQTGCAEPAPPGIKSGLGAWTSTYSGQMSEMAGGEFITMEQGAKMFLAHEIGHNMGLTHTGSLVCSFTEDGAINREPTACKPSWYGDSTSFMGSGQTLQLPAAIRYKVKWLPRSTLKLHPPGSERRWMLRPVTVRRPSWQTGRRVRWFGNSSTGSSADALAVRIPLVNPPDGRAGIGGYTCPCNPVSQRDMESPGVCPACIEALQQPGSNPCKDGPCCTDLECADAGLTWYYVELHMPFRNDYGSTYRGVAIRMMGELSSSSCRSTRQVPTHVEGGQLKYLLNQADPSGAMPGSKFVDTLRGVTVVLEQWTNTSAIVRINA